MTEKYNVEIETNTHGGKGTKLDADLTEVPPRALLAVGRRMKLGASTYGSKNWRNVLLREELNHLLTHAVNAVDALDHIAADSFEWDRLRGELTGAACRALMALETALGESATKLLESPYGPEKLPELPKTAVPAEGDSRNLRPAYSADGHGDIWVLLPGGGWRQTGHAGHSW